MLRPKAFSEWDRVAWTRSRGMLRRRPPTALGYSQTFNSQISASMIPGTNRRATLKSLGLWALMGVICYIAASVFGPFVGSRGVPGSFLVAFAVLTVCTLFGHWGMTRDAARHAVRERRKRTAFLRSAIVASSPQQIDATANEIDARRRRLKIYNSESSLFLTARRTQAFHPMSVKLTAGASVCMLICMAMPRQYTDLMFAFVFLFFSMTIAGVVVAGRAARRVATSIDECRCPDCGYSLLGAPSGVPALGDKGQIIGPARCPECGSPWPLVPPVLNA